MPYVRDWVDEEAERIMTGLGSVSVAIMKTPIVLLAALLLSSTSCVAKQQWRGSHWNDGGDIMCYVGMDDHPEKGNHFTLMQDKKDQEAFFIFDSLQTWKQDSLDIQFVFVRTDGSKDWLHVRNVPNNASAHAVAFNITPELQRKLLRSQTLTIAYKDGTNDEDGKKRIEMVNFQFPGNNLFTFLKRCIDAKGLPTQDLN